ncbi:hypothetical protein MA16_Dca004361 [Dendrobium catenatum]|uniref:Uncharacterized protein n=1 Tax=Dendrobium catenatum TaxID=906689 RepID=A0A2I0W781_9ASPA|nr:hypothetical protein MA16_Dca004361 [Dendrobium catenatum]
MSHSSVMEEGLESFFSILEKVENPEIIHLPGEGNVPQIFFSLLEKISTSNMFLHHRESRVPRGFDFKASLPRELSRTHQGHIRSKGVACPKKPSGLSGIRTVGLVCCSILDSHHGSPKRRDVRGRQWLQENYVIPAQTLRPLLGWIFPCSPTSIGFSACSLLLTRLAEELKVHPIFSRILTSLFGGFLSPESNKWRAAEVDSPVQRKRKITYYRRLSGGQVSGGFPAVFDGLFPTKFSGGFPTAYRRLSDG